MEFCSFVVSRAILCIFIFDWWERIRSHLGWLPLVIWTPKEKTSEETVWELSGVLWEDTVSLFEIDLFLYCRNCNYDDKSQTYSCKESGRRASSELMFIKRIQSVINLKITPVILDMNAAVFSFAKGWLSLSFIKTGLRGIKAPQIERQHWFIVICLCA